MSSVRILRSLAAVAAALSAALPAQAATSVGTIGVSLTVTNACVINGSSSVQADAGSLGSINFPTQPGIFGDVDSQMIGAMGALQVLCSPGVAPVLTVGSGANDSSGRRRLASSSNTVPYRLFTDSGRTNEITIGQQIALGTATTSAINVPIYARVNSGGVVLPAGTYTDIVQVTLSW